MEWQNNPDRGCADMGHMFFDDSHDRHVNQAKLLCVGCPVRNQCLQSAMDNEERWGVWGGYTTLERYRLLAGMRPKVCPSCGIQFVGVRAGCGQCVKPSQGALFQLLEEQGDRIGIHFGQGMTDADIAEIMAEELDQHVSVHSITRVRRRHIMSDHRRKRLVRAA